MWQLEREPPIRAKREVRIIMVQFFPRLVLFFARGCHSDSFKYMEVWIQIRLDFPHPNELNPNNPMFWVQ